MIGWAPSSRAPRRSHDIDDGCLVQRRRLDGPVHERAKRDEGGYQGDGAEQTACKLAEWTTSTWCDVRTRAAGICPPGYTDLRCGVAHGYADVPSLGVRGHDNRSACPPRDTIRIETDANMKMVPTHCR